MAWRQIVADPESRTDETIVPPVLSERYVEVQVLAEGGMGKVFRAKDTALNKVVAIKLLHRGTFDAKAIVRFQQEARILSKLNHQSIVQVYDFHSTDSGEFYLIMEYVEG